MAADSGRAASLIVHLMVGVAFGIVATRGEIVSWYRIQEMFRFQDFHMYGVLGSGVAVAAIGIRILRRRAMKTPGGEDILLQPKDMGRGYRVVIGGILFGLGWGLVGSCPGPIFVLIGNGVSVMWAVLAAALVGTWVYGQIRGRLPH